MVILGPRPKSKGESKVGGRRVREWIRAFAEDARHQPEASSRVPARIPLARALGWYAWQEAGNDVAWTSASICCAHAAKRFEEKTRRPVDSQSDI